MNELSIFDSLFNDVLGSNVAPVLTTYAHAPKVNVFEEDDAYTLEMELPGRTEKDVNIELKNNNLKISSEVDETKEEKKDKKKNYFVKECYTSSFSRSFSLPTDIDEDSISATFKNGILSVNMKKKAIATPKKIAIAAE